MKKVSIFIKSEEYVEYLKTTLLFVTVGQAGITKLVVFEFLNLQLIILYSHSLTTNLKIYFNKMIH